MTTLPNEVPVAVDYTSRDFYSIRDELISRVQSNVNVPGSGVNWVGNDPADFGVALVEAMAYMGDIINYYVDRIANETYIGTATQRQNIINLAKSYGYSPSGYRNATIGVKLYNDSDVGITVPSGSQVSGQAVFNDVVEELIFTLEADAVVPAAIDGISGESNEVYAVHGEKSSTRAGNDPIYGELVGTSTGLPEQTFLLGENQVVESSIEVYVQVGDTARYDLWRLATHISDTSPTDPVFTVDTDADNFVFITFGDGISGAIPTPGAAVYVNYYIGGGEIGNVAADFIDTIYKVPTGVEIGSLTATNTTSGSGGANPESNGSIRYNAPKSLSALNRAVTLKDYSNLSLAVNNVGKANAVAETKNSVTLYITPQQSSTSTDLYPGYTDDPSTTGVVTADWTSMKEDVKKYLEDKTQIGVSLTVSPPTYVPVNLLAYFTRFPQYTDDQVKANIVSALVSKFSYNYLAFADVIAPEEIEYQLRGVEGVYNVKVIAFYKNGDTGKRTLLGGPGEIFVFEEANIDIQVSSIDATLSNLTNSVGTLSPTFASGVFNYNLAVPNGTTSVDITPTNSTATILVNSVATVSGTGQTVAVPIGLSTIPVTVTAQNGINTQAYRITVSRAS